MYASGGVALLGRFASFLSAYRGSSIAIGYRYGMRSCFVQEGLPSWVALLVSGRRIVDLPSPSAPDMACGRALCRRGCPPEAFHM